MAREDLLIQRWLLAGAAGALAIPLGAATADFVGVSYEVMDFSPDDGTTYRFYLEFDDPADQLLEVGGNPKVGALFFLTNTVLVNNGGAFSGTRYEDFPAYPLTGIDDSWVTIGGTTFGAHDTDYSNGIFGGTCVPNAPCFQGSSFEDPNNGWFDSIPETPETPDEFGRIVIGQLTVRDVEDGSQAFAHLEATAEWVSASGVINHNFFVVNATACPPFADLDGSGVVDFGDLLRILAAWGPCDGCPEDIRVSGEVDIYDVERLFLFWGACE